MGANFMDYIIADKIIIPDENKKFYSEEPIYLPNSYMITDNTRKISRKKLIRNDFGLPEKVLFFVHSIIAGKYSKEFNIWMSILSKIDDSVIWLKDTNTFKK